MKNKIILISFGFLILLIVGQSLYFKYKLSKQSDLFEKEILTIKDSLDALDQRQVKLISQGKQNTDKAAKDKKSINDKQKQDEKDIDNSVISDADIADFLSRHSN